LSYIIYTKSSVKRDYFVLKMTDFGINVSSDQQKSITFVNDPTGKYDEIMHFKRRNMDYIIFNRDRNRFQIARSSNGTLGTYEQPKDLLIQEKCRTPSIVQDSKGNDVLIWGSNTSPYNVYAAGLLWQSDGWPILVDFPVKMDKPESIREYPSFRKNHLLYLLAGNS